MTRLAILFELVGVVMFLTSMGTLPQPQMQALLFVAANSSSSSSTSSSRSHKLASSSSTTAADTTSNSKRRFSILSPESDFHTTSSSTTSTSTTATTSTSASTARGNNCSQEVKEAIHNFQLHLQFLGKEVFDEEAFEMLLDDIGYKRCREGLFDNLLDEVANSSSSSSSSNSASSSSSTFFETQQRPSTTISLLSSNMESNKTKRRCISVEDMSRLYQSDPYMLPMNGRIASGEALQSHLRQLYEDADVCGRKLLDMKDLRTFLMKLLDVTELTDGEVDEAMKAIDTNNDGFIHVEEFMKCVMNPTVINNNKNKQNYEDSRYESKISFEATVVGDTFDEALLSPTHTSVENFVSKLEEYSTNHLALTHDFLNRLSNASFGLNETANILFLFVSAYSTFNSGFVSNIEMLLTMVDDEDHTRILKENLNEEMGLYDEKTLCDLESLFDIRRESVEHVTHRNLFIDLVEFVHTATLAQRPPTICSSDKITVAALKLASEPMNQAISYAKEHGKLGLLAVLYFGSELIVPTLYSSILQGLKKSLPGGVSDENVKFLLLHIDMDSHHAAALREIILESCKTEADRAILVTCTKRLLNARVEFYNSILRLSSSDSTKQYSAAVKPEKHISNKLAWGSSIKRSPQSICFLDVPEGVKQEIRSAVLECKSRGITIDNVDLIDELHPQPFSALKLFSAEIRNSLLNSNGAVLLQGLDLDGFGFTDSFDLEVCAKLAYYFICSHVGTIDGEARGKLFDVKDNNLNAMDSKNDNILFSVSNCKADWHTDGASKDKVYDVVSLMCIHPSESGGNSKISNAFNAYDTLRSRMPKFLMHELLRPVTRDILENGKGNERKMNMKFQVRRSNSIMPYRICYNSYPIFAVQSDRLRFRYMRYWIETAHMKLGWKIPTLLKISMDVLDDTLDEECIFEQRLDRGDILLCNNAFIAHGRDAFQDTPILSPRRHLVRAWIQLGGLHKMLKY